MMLACALVLVGTSSTFCKKSLCAVMSQKGPTTCYPALSLRKQSRLYSPRHGSAGAEISVFDKCSQGFPTGYRKSSELIIGAVVHRGRGLRQNLLGIPLRRGGKQAKKAQQFTDVKPGERYITNTTPKNKTPRTESVPRLHPVCWGAQRG